MADADGAAGNRRKRRCVTNKSVMPSAVHYVGYVEDDETPEAIMKKFEAMEMVWFTLGFLKVLADVFKVIIWAVKGP